MIQELKELLSAFEKLPELALWVAGGFGVYKLITFLATGGMIYKLGSLIVIKGHDWLTSPGKPKTVCIDDIFIVYDGTYERFRKTLLSLRRSTEYIHNSDVTWIIQAIEEKRERDKRVSP